MDAPEGQGSETIRLAYERGRIDGYAECFADFRRIVSEHGLKSFLERHESVTRQNSSDVDGRRLADAVGRDPRNTVVHLFGEATGDDSISLGRQKRSDIAI